LTAPVITLTDVLASSSGPGPVWTRTSADLNVNLISFAAGQGVPEHVNDEVDVLLVAVEGEGVVEVEGVSRSLRAGEICLVPKGVSRSIRSGSDRFAYLTCHRRRAALWPVDEAPSRT
jgi:quercetin dioxygenase-like cupin family protein